MPTPDAVVCIRAKDRPDPDVESSHKESCFECGEDVWVAPSSPTHIKKMCIQCLGLYLAALDAEEEEA